MSKDHEYIKELFDSDGITAPESLSEENMLAMLNAAEEKSAGEQTEKKEEAVQERKEKPEKQHRHERKDRPAHKERKNRPQKQETPAENKPQGEKRSFKKVKTEETAEKVEETSEKKQHRPHHRGHKHHHKPAEKKES